MYVPLIDLYVVESAAKLLKSQTHTQREREDWRNRDRTREREREREIDRDRGRGGQQWRAYLADAYL